LPGADLQGTDLTRADLGGANLAGAFLNDTNLTCANLRGANLQGANLYFADLRGAILEEATLKEIKQNKKTRWPMGFDPQQHERERVQKALEKEWEDVPDGAISRAQRKARPQPTKASLSRTDTPKETDCI